jgi:hypothetical protein
MENEVNGTPVTPEVSKPADTAPTPAPQTGNSEDLKAQVEELKRQKEGVLRDLQQERERRKAVEARQSAPSQPVNAGVAPSDADPVDHLLRTKFEEMYVQRRTAEEDERATTQFLAKEFGIKPEEVPSSPVLKDLQQIVSEYGIRGNSMLNEARTAAELYQRRQSTKAAAEAAQKAKEEADRTANIQQQSPEPTRSVAPASNTVKVSRADIAKMTSQDYSRMLNDAKAKGISIQVE